jgi:hypothetical protein
MIDLSKIYRVLDRAKALDEKRVFVKSIDDETKEYIIYLNTELQLEEEGVFSDGSSTGDYSDLTVTIKRSKGQRYDHMTFKDTGGFYDSFRVQVDTNGFVIDADGQVSADMNLFEFYGENIAGLTNESMNSLIEILIENYIKIVTDELLS